MITFLGISIVSSIESRASHGDSWLGESTQVWRRYLSWRRVVWRGTSYVYRLSSTERPSTRSWFSTVCSGECCSQRWVPFTIVSWQELLKSCWACGMIYVSGVCCIVRIRFGWPASSSVWYCLISRSNCSDHHSPSVTVTSVEDGEERREVCCRLRISQMLLFCDG